MTQREVNQWEIENKSKITGWTADYGNKKVVTFIMEDKTTVKFEIEKDVDSFEEFYSKQ
jgi:hypothetical protein